MSGTGAVAQRRWTEEQQRAIDRRQGDLLLDAAAGSGKTSVLVERYVASVLQDGIDVSAMLTITFTEKAAAELRDRIRARLHALGARDAARRTESAWISTIHGFCARVLRANALAAGLDPHFQVLDRDRSEVLSAQAFEEALAELADVERGAVDLIAAYGVWPLRTTVFSLYAQLRSGGALEPRLPEIVFDPPVRDPAPGAELALAAAEVARELGEIDEPSVRVIEALDRVRRCLELVAADDVWPAALEAVKLPRNGAALSTDACVRYAAALAAFRAQCAARAAGPVRDLLDRLLAGYGARYAAAKQAESGLDFEDLELVTRRLLATDTELAERYASRFARIMVDEFQDTNRVQLELIEAISRANLFTVGDAQQSIYGFRHADVELFEARGRRLAQVGARETLQTNFRSRREILNTLNLGFAEELGDRFRPLVAGRPPAGESRPGADEPAVELVLVDKGAEWEMEGVASPWRVAEARTLAARVAELVASGWAPADIVVLMRATTDMRAYERALEEHGLPTYVIGGRGYWSHPQVVDLVAYLRALANPRDEEALYGVLASPLVGVSLDTLVILAATGRASQRDPWWLLREPRGELTAIPSADAERLRTFTSWFAAERARASRSPIEQLIDGALTHSGYDMTMLAMPGGRRRLANVRKLMRLGREHEAAHGPDLRGFVDLVCERQAGGGADARESEAPMEGEGLDAIRLMTIHRSKGLEFPVVVVADLGRAVRPGSELVRVGSDGRLGIRLARAGAPGRESALDYRELGDEQRIAQEAEERRLFYVAMTRAQERLVLSGAVKFEGFTGGNATGGGPVAWILPALVPDPGAALLEGGGEVDRDGVRIGVRIGLPGDGPAGDEAAEPPPPDQFPADGRAADISPQDPGGDPGPAAVRAVPPVASLSYSALEQYARCGYRFYAERVLGLPPVPEAPGAPGGLEPPAQPGARPSVRSAADRGVLLHALLERLDFRRPAAPAADQVVRAATAAGLAPVPGPAEADELAAIVRGFAGSELCARLAAARDSRREERFRFPITGGAMVTGVLDVLAREPGGRLLVVDYKSDRLAGRRPEAITAGGYRLQRLVYALAGLRSGATAVEIVHCFLEQPDEPATVVFTPADLPRLEQELAQRCRGVLAREFTVADDPHRGLCSGCPAQGGLCSWPLEMTRRESADTLF